MKKSSFENPALGRLNRVCGGDEATVEHNQNGDIVNGEVYINDNTTGNTATYLGVGLKALYFALLVVIVAVLSAAFLPALIVNNPSFGIGVIIAAFVGMIVFGIVATTARKVALWGSLYAVCEAIFLGLISFVYSFEYSGIVFIALLATILAFCAICLAYATGLIKVTQRFRGFILTGLIALLATQLIVFLLSLFMPSLTNIYTDVGFWLQLAICAVGILLACGTIAVDLNNVTNLVQNKLPKRYEWNAAFGLLVSLIWLYIQLLRILTIVLSRRK